MGNHYRKYGKAGHSETNEEKRLDTFEVKGLRKILRVSWTAKKTNDCVLNKAEVKRELLDTIKARKLAYCGHTMRKKGSWLEKKIMQGTMPGAFRRGRPHIAWMDNIKMWTGLPVEEWIRMTENKDKWKKYVHGVVSPRIEDEQNREWNGRKMVVISSNCQQGHAGSKRLLHQKLWGDLNWGCWLTQTVLYNGCDSSSFPTTNTSTHEQNEP